MSDRGKPPKRDRSSPPGSSSNEPPARKRYVPPQSSTLGDLYGDEPSRDSGRSRTGYGGGRQSESTRHQSSALSDLYGAEPSRDYGRSRGGNSGGRQSESTRHQSSALSDLYGDEPSRDSGRSRGGYGGGRQPESTRHQSSALSDLYGAEPSRDYGRSRGGNSGGRQSESTRHQSSALSDLYGDEPSRDSGRSRGGYGGGRQPESTRHQSSALSDLYGAEPSRDSGRDRGGRYPPNRGVPRGRPPDPSTSGRMLGQAPTGSSFGGPSRGYGADSTSRSQETAGAICRANYFSLGCLPTWTLQSYTAAYSPNIESLSMRKGLVKSHKELFGIYIFDGNTLYTRNKLETPMQLICVRNEDNSKVEVTLTLKSIIEEGDPFFLQLWSIVFRKCLSALKFHLLDRNYYDLEGKKSVAGFNLELWPGYKTGIHLREKMVLLNVDVCYKVLRKETAYDVYKESRKGGDPDWEKVFTSAMVGAVVLTPYNNRSYRIDDVDFTKTPESTFPTKKGGETKFLDYYQERYGLRIYDLNQPILISIPKEKDVRKGNNEPVALIPELCCLTGISDTMRADFRLMRGIANTTRNTPQDRIHMLQSELMAKILRNEEAQTVLREWHIFINPELADVPCRILPPEKIVLKKNVMATADSRTADFGRCFRNQHLFMTVNIGVWAILFPRRVSGGVEKFVALLTRTSRDMGVVMHPPTMVQLQDDQTSTYLYELEKLISQRPLQLAMFVVPNDQTARYDSIKKKCYIERSVPSQVVLARNLDGKGAGSIATKIAIQLNCKVGGSPWTAVFPFKQTVMVVGYTVCKDSKNKSCSYSCVVATMNGNFTRYFSEVAKSSTGGTMSDTIGFQLATAVTTFSKTNGGPPKKIIIYRDGASQGMFTSIREHELEKIKESLVGFYPDAESIELALIVVLQRTNTRLFFENNNPCPGTVVDSVITTPFEHDFFLVSQSVRQGTVSPTHYVMLHDTANLPPDAIQKLTYKLTHLYFNWSGTIKVPAPLMYASKLGVMVSQHLHNIPGPGLQETLYYL